MPHDRHWAPCHAVMATPLLVAFEILLFNYFDFCSECIAVVNLKIVFLPLLAFETVILIDNIRMCRALMPGDEESMSDEAIWETLPHFWVAISMVFFIAATIFTLLKLCGDLAVLGWWDLFINYGIAECFAFLVCTKWYNPVIHRHSRNGGPSSSSTSSRYVDWNRGLMVSDEDEHHSSGICNPQDIGGHFMKIPFIVFQIMLFMHLEGTPPSAEHIPSLILFAPLLLIQGAGVLFAAYRLMEKIVLLLNFGAGSGRYFAVTSKAHDYFGFLHRGSRLLGWWSIDEGSSEERARLYCSGGSGYVFYARKFSAFLQDFLVSFPLSRGIIFSEGMVVVGGEQHLCWGWAALGGPSVPDHPTITTAEIVKKKPKSELVDEIRRLHALLIEQTEITKFSQEECERLQNDKILCRICFEGQINVVLLPCRHHALCSTCCEKCNKCPICRIPIEERLPVYDV
ncbi:hypothetical protein SADUNF_Sadunf08G0094800 [Salix dunnii]|uniref:RING-type domain-containing protein n=1 Tax=Salix dunnii TaxID=1413687 RepID=A0A835JTT5_9ROSI|nr:hypothetical protein SADUNF_Sadunf08G0094800 [Salix dunnii]